MVLILLHLWAFQAIGLEQKASVSTCISGASQNISSRLPLWAEQALTLQNWLTDSGSPQAFLSTFVQEIYTKNPAEAALLTTCFSSPSAQWPKRLAKTSLATLYETIALIDFLDITNPSFRAEFIHYCIQRFLKKPYKSLKLFASSTHPIKDHIRKSIVTCHTLFLSLSTATIIKNRFSNGTERAVMACDRAGTMALLFAETHQEVDLFNLTSFIPIRSIKVPENIAKAQLNHDGSQVATLSSTPRGSYDAHLWRTHTGELLYTILNSRIFKFDTIGRLIATVSYDVAVNLYDASTGVRLHRLTGHTKKILEVAFNPLSTLILTASYDNTIALWHGETYEHLHTLHVPSLICVHFSTHGTYIITDSCTDVADTHLWSTATGKCHLIISDRTPSGIWHRERKATCDDTDTQLAMVCPNRTVQIWDIAQGTSRAILHGHESTIEKICFAHNGNLVITTGRDNRVYLWHAKTSALLCFLRAPVDDLTHVTYIPIPHAYLTSNNRLLVLLWPQDTLVSFPLQAPYCSLEQAILIHLIARKKGKYELFNFETPKNRKLLPLFLDLDPAWQRVLQPFVTYPKETSIGRFFQSLSCCNDL